MKKIKPSYIATAVLLLLLVAWMASGLLFSGGDAAGTDTADERQANNSSEKELMKVEVSKIFPQLMERNITLQGQLHARRQLLIKADTSGSIESLPVEKGSHVAADDLIAGLSIEGRDSQLREAQARISTAASEQAATNKLQQQGLQSQLKAEQAKATLASAEAALQRIELEISHTEIRAPFAGIINQLPIEIGQQIEKGTVIASLVDNSSFRATAHVAQQSVHKLKVGQQLDVRLITGTQLQGRLSYISAVADAATRSFEIEAEVDNNGQQLAAGTSASVIIPVEKIEAFFVSPSTIALGDNGDIGIKTVDDNNKVKFYPIKLVETRSTGAWVTGVAAGSRVITLGQGFVIEGQQVEPIEAAAAAAKQAAN